MSNKIIFIKTIFHYFLILLVVLILSQNINAQDNIAHVRIGITPYSMYQIWKVAKDFSFDKEFGLDFSIVELSQNAPGINAMLNGELDVSSNAMPQLIATKQNAPEITLLSPLGYFKGFIFVGRNGQTQAIDDLIDSLGPLNAKEFQLKEMKGKTFVIVPIYKSMILDAIAQVGLTENDVKFLNFADDQKAAVAFINGSGDFYIGSLPQERRLLEMSDQYVNAGGSEILGPAGIWYDIDCTTKKFLSENRETALKVLAAKYRSIRFFEEHPEQFAQKAVDSLNKLTGSEFSINEYVLLQTIYDDFLSIEDVLIGCFNPSSPLYMKKPVEYNIKMSIESGDIKDPYSPEEIYKEAEDLFYELLTRRDLLEKIYAPF